MIRATIKKIDNTYLDHGNFISEESALSWFQPFINKGVYGTSSEFVIIYEDITAELSAEKDKADKIETGKKARETCQKVLDFIAGENLDKELTLEQITEMQTLFSQAEMALRAGRPTLAKLAISAIEPDGILVSESTKSTCLELLADY